MSQRIKYGVIGVGTAGGWYADILKQSPGAQLSAALRSPGGDTKSVEERWGVPCYTDMQAFLSSVDAVCIATPSGQHYQQAKSALEANKHVLIEKPITLKENEAFELLQLAQNKNLRLGVTLQRRADPMFIKIKHAIDTGAIGTPVLLNLVMPYYRAQSYYDSAAWRGTPEQDGGGILMNQGIHLVDLSVWFLGNVKHVSAYKRTLARNINVEDTISVALEFSCGALGSIAGTTASEPGVTHRLEVCGTLGSFAIEGERVVRWDVKDLPKPEQPLAADAAASDPKQTSTVNHARIIKNFTHAIQTGQDPLVTADDAVHALAVVNAAYRSAETNTRVTLP